MVDAQEEEDVAGVSVALETADGPLGDQLAVPAAHQYLYVAHCKPQIIKLFSSLFSRLLCSVTETKVVVCFLLIIIKFRLKLLCESALETAQT